jgi:hypothetical protein
MMSLAVPLSEARRSKEAEGREKRRSSLNWVMMRPKITTERWTHSHQVREDVKLGRRPHISHADVADFLGG